MGKSKPKDIIISRELIEQIKHEVTEDLSNKEVLNIRNEKLGLNIEMHSSENMDDLIQKALVVKTNFFNDKDTGRNYIG